MADIVDLECAGIGVTHKHVGLAGIGGEVAKTCDLPLRSNLTHRGGPGDAVVADIVDFELAGIGVAHQHVSFAGIPGEIAKSRDLPFQPHLTQRGTASHVVVADVETVNAPVAVLRVSRSAVSEPSNPPMPTTLSDVLI